MMTTAVPIATYRLQLTARFGFAQATAIVPYLKALGISHLYVSPFLKARHGSTHGYDVVDHNALNPELGGEEGLQQLSAGAGRHGPDPRFCAQPYGRPLRRQRLVARRPGVGPGVALRGFLRH